MAATRTSKKLYAIWVRVGRTWHRLGTFRLAGSDIREVSIDIHERFPHLDLSRVDVALILKRRPRDWKVSGGGSRHYETGRIPADSTVQYDMSARHRFTSRSW